MHNEMTKSKRVRERERERERESSAGRERRGREGREGRVKRTEALDVPAKQKRDSCQQWRLPSDGMNQWITQ